MIALRAGRSAAPSSFRIWVSTMERKSGRTESDAKDRVVARPGR